MRMRLSMIAVLILLFVTAVPAPLAAQPNASRPEPALVLTFQTRPDIRPETLRRIVDLVEARREVVTEDAATFEILRENYGSSHWKLRELFADLNDGRTVIQAGEEVTLPPAPEWEFDVVVTVPDTTDVESYIETKMATAGPRTKSAVARASRVRRSDLETLRPGAQLVLPYVSHVVSYDVKANVSAQDAKRIAAEIQASDDAVELMAVSRELMLTPHVTRVAAAPASCPVAPPRPVGHCNVADLASVPNVRRAVLALLDSGVPNRDTRFRFWNNPGEAGKKRWRDDDRNDYIDDVIGTDMLMRGGYPQDDVTVDSMRNHGTHVAGIASCRTASTAHRAAVDDRVELMVLKVAAADGSISPHAVDRAVLYAIDYHADVVNMSFEGEPNPVVRAFVRSAEKILFVAAAGNGENKMGFALSTDERARRVFPAELSATLPNVITVAAHDGGTAPQLTCFSNFGDIVDIAAPGLGVRSTVIDGEAELSGTSQAAPLVALAGALLHSRGLNGPKAIRERLVSSADYAPELRGIVRAEGVVNVEKALAYDRDIVRTQDAVYYGDLAPFTIATDGTTTALPALTTRKIINSYAGDGSLKIVSDSGSRVVTASLPTISIRTKTENVTLVGDRIIEIVPRLR